ncbi:hypothetical protein OJF2_54270 [Aquisphaera giovannonii]|uniref:Uncharacterized protein n=1 Tax=Aquisphaera giovannonii TaxID=406548 RepID=A0A5B9W882_9BACT|nr:hypothetical protein [Aquisphaera giovannonii]QEH36842.1 hypothetical protein OJF2_54270 [Aquisphaera giovannonii]
MIDRIRRVLPPPPFTLLFLISFIVIEGPLLYLEWKFEARADLRVRPGELLVGLATLVLGSYRVLAFHPFYLRSYRKWLEQTPWTIHKPLPLGPISLTWADGIAVGLLVILTLNRLETHAIRICTLFLIAHAVWLALTFWPTGIGTQGYLCVFGLGFCVRFWHEPWACLAAAVVASLVAHAGLRRSLARFPWRGHAAEYLTIHGPDLEELVGWPCGWPFDQLYRDVRIAGRFRMNTADAILVSMLAGWAAFCLAGLHHDSDERGGFALVMQVPCMLFVPLLRLGIYVGCYRPPVSLVGRIRSGRWIIPGYDRCLAAPLLAMLCGGATVLVLRKWLPTEVAASIAICTIMLISLASPPGLREWRLTGAHRITHGILAKGPNAPFVEVG